MRFNIEQGKGISRGHANEEPKPDLYKVANRGARYKEGCIGCSFFLNRPVQHTAVTRRATADMSEIVEFYRGKNILITGAAGFLGGLLMERLLRICEVGRIFIIVRDKNGLKAEERLDSIFSTPVFDRLRQLKPSFLNLVQLVKGDIELPGLGLSDLARAMLVEEIEVVFHGAATVSFDEPIKKATLVNVRGTKEMALLCQEMKNLK
ncbi:hypothetical protein GE061_017204, partial [Apolygus lucorum]